MKVVILAAGFGSRLWPLSTPEKPKQFQPLISGQSLLQYTYGLCTQFADTNEISVLTLQGLEHLITEQLPEVENRRIIVVPERRNTLPHVLFALSSLVEDEDEPVLFTPVDHLIVEEQVFVMSLRRIIGNNSVLKNVTLLGNYSDLFDHNAGYFTTDENHRITKFIEKPESLDIFRQTGDTPVIKDTAMLLASKRTMTAALTSMSDETAEKGQKLLSAAAEERRERFLAMPFIDIATGFYEMAQTLRAEFADGDFVDLGSFESLYKTGKKDSQGNVKNGNVIVDDMSHNNYIFNWQESPLVVINTSDSVIVQNQGGTVIAPLSRINTVGGIYKSQIHPDTKKSR